MPIRLSDYRFIIARRLLAADFSGARETFSSQLLRSSFDLAMFDDLLRGLDSR